MTILRKRRRELRSLLAIAFLTVAASGAARAEAWLGIGAAAFDGAGNLDDASRGAQLIAGIGLRDWLALEAGLIDQSGDTHYPRIPSEFSEYGWRALHVGPRVQWRLAERWRVHAGLALAHVSLDREHASFETVDMDTPYTIGEGVAHRDSSFGALARLGVSYDLTPRQSLALEWQRLHAGLQERCEPVSLGDVTGYECGHLGHAATDGAALSWRMRFD